jgi:hypothetical protein
MKWQGDDGSWVYGTLPYHQWIDNFHTGFNLVCLKDFIDYSGDTKLIEALDKGASYYEKNLFLNNGVPKYFSNKLYPIDAHSVAQGIITFLKLGNYDMAKTIAHWAVDNLQHPKGFFYYQIHEHYKNKISYMRWSQAFMVRALTDLVIYDRIVQ